MTVHALSFDVENWYDGNLFEPGQMPSDDRVVAEMDCVLELLARHDVKVTFFILGNLAERYPGMVRAVAEAGHEIGCHGYTHEMVSTLTPQRLTSDLTRARKLLQDLSGQPVSGFRAPSWSVNRAALAWVIPVLAEVGFGYSSSIHPIWTPLYGMASAPVDPWYHRLPDGRRLPEIPPAVIRLGPVRLPVGGGAYWRVLPTPLIEAVLRYRPRPGCFYLHPWELNPSPAPVPAGVGWISRTAATLGVRRMLDRLERLLTRVSFGPISHVYHAFLQGEESA